MPPRQVTVEDLEPSTTIPHGRQLSGKLAIVWPTVAKDAATSGPVLKFGLSVKLDHTTPYNAQADSKTPKASFQVHIHLKSTDTDAAAVLAAMTTDNKWLNKSFAKAMVVNCSGARILSRDRKDKHIQVTMELNGPLSVQLGGTERTLLDIVPAPVTEVALARHRDLDSTSSADSSGFKQARNSSASNVGGKHALADISTQPRMRPLGQLPELKFANTSKRTLSTTEEPSKRPRINNAGASRQGRVNMVGVPTTHNVASGPAFPGPGQTVAPSSTRHPPPNDDLDFWAQEDPVSSFGSQASDTRTNGRPAFPKQLPSAPHTVDSPVPVDLPRVSAMPNPVDARAVAEARARKQAEDRVAAEQAVAAKQQASVKQLESVLDAGAFSYTPLNDVRPGSYVNVMGVVKRSDSERQTRKDWICTVIIADPTSHTADTVSEDMAVTIFRPKKEQLGAFVVGTPIAFRGLKSQEYNGKVKGNAYSNDPNEWFFYNGGAAVAGPSGPHPTLGPLTVQEMDRLKALGNWWRQQSDLGSYSPQNLSLGSHEQLSPTASSSQKFKLLAQVEPDQFFNATVKILDVRPLDRRPGPSHEIYVTDGTVSRHSTRNFHGTRLAGLPPNGLFCLAAWDCTPDDAECLRAGNFVHFPNLRSPMRQGEIELKWSEKMTQQQQAGGWKPRRLKLIEPGDPSAVAIDKRLKDLKHGITPREPVEPEVAVGLTTPLRPAVYDSSLAAGAAPRTFHESGTPSRPSGASPTPLESAPIPAPPIPAPQVPGTAQLARHIFTTFTDNIAHTITPLADAVNNNTHPNRFRIQARVSGVYGRNVKGAKPKDLAVLWCKKCSASFKGHHCGSCNDKDLAQTEVRWQMIVRLEEPGKPDHLCAVLEGREAEAILPPLPPVAFQGGPNKVDALRDRISRLSTKVEDVLLGAPMDNVRPRPIIDWTLETHVVQVPGAKNKPGITVWRVFGMQTAE